MTTYLSAEKPYRGIGMEGAIARWYAGLTKKSLDEFTALARRVSETLPAGGRVLEVAPGPGYFAIELAKRGEYRITGLDISGTMVQLARTHAAEANCVIDFQHGDAAHMPFEGRTFDYIMCRAAFKNFTQPVRALEEMYRVLKPGGQAVIIDLRRNASQESIHTAVAQMKLGRVNAFVTRQTFRFILLRRAYTKSDFAQMIAQTKFHAVEMREDSIGLEITLTK